MLCSVRGTLYAYRDVCAACGAGLGEARLEREVLTCPCGASYDVTRAGRGLDPETLHLERTGWTRAVRARGHSPARG